MRCLLFLMCNFCIGRRHNVPETQVCSVKALKHREDLLWGTWAIHPLVTPRYLSHCWPKFRFNSGLGQMSLTGVEPDCSSSIYSLKLRVVWCGPFGARGFYVERLLGSVWVVSVYSDFLSCNHFISWTSRQLWTDLGCKCECEWLMSCISSLISWRLVQGAPAMALINSALQLC